MLLLPGNHINKRPEQHYCILLPTEVLIILGLEEMEHFISPLVNDVKNRAHISGRNSDLSIITGAHTEEQPSSLGLWFGCRQCKSQGDVSLEP